MTAREAIPDRDLRRLLLDAAREILSEPETPLELRKVAERAGKSRTAPYLVFGRESDGGGLLGLKIAVAAEGAAEMARRMAEAAGAHPGAPLEALEAVALAFLGFVEENPRLFRLMYGSDINALPKLGREGLLKHPEFRALLEHRDHAGAVVDELIMEAQDQGFLPVDDEEEGGAITETRAGRRLLLAWSTMIGMALLRDDDLLHAIGWDISREDGARMIVESIVGLDLAPLADAVGPFLSASAEEPPSVEERAPAEGPVRAAPPSAGEPALSRVLLKHPGLHRAARSLSVLSRARILWIDDHPASIANQVATLEGLGAAVTVVRTSHEGERALRRAGPDGFDLLISDIRRGSRPDAGVRALPRLRRLAPTVPVVFFVGRLEPERGVPAGAAGITNRSDELLHLVLDALEGR